MVSGEEFPFVHTYVNVYTYTLSVINFEHLSCGLLDLAALSMKLRGICYIVHNDTIFISISRPTRDSMKAVSNLVPALLSLGVQSDALDTLERCKRLCYTWDIVAR